MSPIKETIKCLGRYSYPNPEPWLDAAGREPWGGFREDFAVERFEVRDTVKRICEKKMSELKNGINEKEIVKIQSETREIL